MSILVEGRTSISYHGLDSTRDDDYNYDRDSESQKRR